MADPQGSSICRTAISSIENLINGLLEASRNRMCSSTKMRPEWYFLFREIEMLTYYF